jgi:hypothetical protein
MTTKVIHRVEELFENALDRSAEVRENPVTGGTFIAGLDPLRPQKIKAQAALDAREWFAAHKPDDAPELPIRQVDREDLKVEGLPYIVSVFARSLADRNYQTDRHPKFDEYARGVMASDMTPDFIRNDAQLIRRYPPVPLGGMGPGLKWLGPKLSATRR